MWERVAPGEENSVGKGTRVETRPGLCLPLSKSADGERVRAPTSGGGGGACSSPYKATSEAVSHFCQRRLIRVIYWVIKWGGKGHIFRRD